MSQCIKKLKYIQDTIELIFMKFVIFIKHCDSI
jgi:hypothetical protein